MCELDPAQPSPAFSSSSSPPSRDSGTSLLAVSSGQDPDPSWLTPPAWASPLCRPALPRGHRPHSRASPEALGLSHTPWLSISHSTTYQLSDSGQISKPLGSSFLICQKGKGILPSPEFENGKERDGICADGRYTWHPGRCSTMSPSGVFPGLACTWGDGVGWGTAEEEASASFELWGCSKGEVKGVSRGCWWDAKSSDH